MNEAVGLKGKAVDLAGKAVGLKGKAVGLAVKAVGLAVMHSSFVIRHSLGIWVFRHSSFVLGWDEVRPPTLFKSAASGSRRETH
jgi:hypothetical protein